MIDELRRRLQGRVERDLPLAPLTTYGIGGPADIALFPASRRDLERAIGLLHERGLPWVVLGGGSNVLVSDRGVRGAVLLTTGLARIEVRGGAVVAEAGAQSHAVAVAAQRAGLTGAEFLAWLPGTVGGACLMNARAYGGEVSQILRRARVVTPAGDAEELTLEPGQFAYKRSPLAGRGLVIAEVTLELAPGDPAAIQAAMDGIEVRRRANHEMDHPSCGCVFKNDYSIGISSGQVVDRCGLKGYAVGAARVSPHHANFVINTGGASAVDVRRVIEHVRAEVERQTGHRLELEVQLLGEWDEAD